MCEGRSDRITMLRLSLCLLLASHSACAMLAGWVESPGYPSGYMPYASLNWSRCAPPGHILSLVFTHLDLEDSQDCENDAVEIFSNGNLISILCGQSKFEELQSSVNPSLHSSPGGCLSLSFHADYSNVKRNTGFRGFYTVQDFDECQADPDNKCTHFCHNYIGGYYCSCRLGYHLDTDKHTCTVSCTEDRSGSKKGVISSPSWPGPYAENADCSYTLSVENHLQLELHFSKDFDVEQAMDGHCIDSLKVQTSRGTLGPFCGHVPPSSPLLTHSHHVQILFSSDGFGSNAGFTVQYKTRAKVCPGVVTSKTSMTPQKHQYQHGDTVKVTCELGYSVDTYDETLSMSEYMTTCQISGIWSPIYNCEPVNCGMPDIPDNGILQLMYSDEPSTLFGDQIQLKCNSMYYTLEGDDTYICNASSAWVSVGSKTDMPRCIEVCGKTFTDSSSAGRIWGGEQAKLGEIPWQLFIRQPRGGASLINDQWAVTAAHVVDGLEEIPFDLYGGLIDGKKTLNMPSDVVVMGTDKIIIHPNYVKGVKQRTNFDNDIALIRLASRVTLGPNLLPICLPEAGGDLRENEQGTVSGWGSTELFEKSQMLRYAHISGYSFRECQSTPRLQDTPMIFTNNMFCAGSSTGQGKDSCRGDSGGPFILPALGNGNRDNRGPYRLIGIVSWGPGCDGTDFKGYYTKVERYVNWIKQTIESVEKEERDMNK